MIILGAVEPPWSVVVICCSALNHSGPVTRPQALPAALSDHYYNFILAHMLLLDKYILE